jgi:hypothetical protein
VPVGAPLGTTVTVSTVYGIVNATDGSVVNLLNIRDVPVVVAGDAVVSKPRANDAVAGGSVAVDVVAVENPVFIWGADEVVAAKI